MQAPQLENRLPDEGINTSEEHPLREFAWLITAGLVSFGLLLALMTWFASYFAPKIPFRYEQQLAQQLKLGEVKAGYEAQQQYLQALVSRIVPLMHLQEGMSVQVRYDPSRIVNAYATLGGHVVVYAGLMDRLPSEAALATLLAHEIAHVKHRDVAASAGRGVAIAMALGMLSVDAGGRAAQSVFGVASQAALMSYSRDQEHAADAAALAAVVALYGHGAGYTELFEALQKEEAKLPEAMRSAGFMRSHPLTQDRLQAALDLAAQKGWPLVGSSPLIPDTMKSKAAAPSNADKP